VVNAHTPFQRFKPPDHVPARLFGLRNWIGWRKRKDSITGKVDKLPICIVDGKGDDFHNPARHVSYMEAVKAINRLKLDGVGFVMTRESSLIGGDLDKCVGPDGVIADWAKAILDLGETYCEISPSGKGVRFWCVGSLPNNVSCVKFNKAGVELYAAGRFLTFSGLHIAETSQEVREAPRLIEALIARVNAARARDAAQRAGQADPQPPESDIIAFQRWCYWQTPLGKLNQMAIADYEAWVPETFPGAVYYDTGRYWRVHSADRGRPDLMEDISFHPEGITDWAVHDEGDHRQGKRTAIDIVIEFGLGLADLDQPGALQAALEDPDNAMAAARSLAGQLKISDEDFYAMGFNRPDPEPTDDDPVDLWKATTDAPRLPEGLLPPRVEAFVRVNAKAIGGDPAGLAGASIAVLAAAIADTVRLKVQGETWRIAARIWAALVGDPSTKKTPMIKKALATLEEHDRRRRQDYAFRKSLWDAQTKQEKAEALAAGRGPPDHNRIIIGDITAESAGEIIMTSPNGVLAYHDELSGFFASMERYNPKGSDRAFWLHSRDGGPFSVDRITRGSNYIPNLSVSLVGGIQPEPMRKVAAGSTDDGLIQRLTPIMLRPAELTDDNVDTSAADRDFAQPIDALLSLGGATIRFDEGAQRVRREMEIEHFERTQSWAAINRKLASAFGKQDGFFAELCLIWHATENATAVDVDGIADLPELIAEDTAARVAVFMRRFLRPHLMAFYRGLLDLADGFDDLRSIGGYILTHRPEKMNSREVQKSIWSMRKSNARDVAAVMEQLEAFGWLFRHPPPRFGALPVWKVNPVVHVLFARQAEEEAERRAKIRETIVRDAAERRAGRG
jgi:hypothetical protein